MADSRVSVARPLQSFAPVLRSHGSIWRTRLQIRGGGIRLFLQKRREGELTADGGTRHLRRPPGSGGTENRRKEERKTRPAHQASTCDLNVTFQV